SIVTLQVLPVSAGVLAGIDGPFTILGFPEGAEPDIVSLDSLAANLFLERADDVRLYRQVFERLSSTALPPDDSTEFISKLADGYRHQAAVRESRIHPEALRR